MTSLQISVGTMVLMTMFIVLSLVLVIVGVGFVIRVIVGRKKLRRALRDVILIKAALLDLQENAESKTAQDALTVIGAVQEYYHKHKILEDSQRQFLVTMTIPTILSIVDKTFRDNEKGIFFEKVAESLKGLPGVEINTYEPDSPELKEKLNEYSSEETNLIEIDPAALKNNDKGAEG